MTKQFIEIEVPENTDPFEVREKLKMYRGVHKSYPITCTKLRVYYDESKMPLERLIKVVKNGGKDPGNQKTKKNKADNKTL